MGREVAGWVMVDDGDKADEEGLGSKGRSGVRSGMDDEVGASLGRSGVKLRRDWI